MSEIEPQFVTPVSNKTVSALKRNSLNIFADTPLVIPPSPFMKRLGCGTYVTVYRYKRKNVSGDVASPWALKKAKHGHARQSIKERLANEAEILRTLSHPNIVVFKNFCQTIQGDMCLSMEDCGKGLDSIIINKQQDDEVFTSTEIVKVSYSLAKALDYLHNIKKLLHGDLKSGNVLIKDKFKQVKLCDFGVSIFLKDDLSGPKNENAIYIGSEPWISREVSEDSIITDKADIFSYGLVIWEMLALDVPHVGLMTESEDLDGSFSDTSNSSLTYQAYYDALGTRPPLPDYVYDKSYDAVIAIFVCCTNENYKERPNAKSLVESISMTIDTM